jgi:hypothetical protein
MSKIITPDNDAQQAVQPASLSRQRFNEIAGALARLAEINENTILSPTVEAELKGVREFLTNAFVQHGSEFLGAWNTLKEEYQPLLRAFAIVTSRVSGILIETERHRAAAAEKKSE